MLALGTAAIPLASAHASELEGGRLVVTRTDEAADCPDETALTQATLALGTLPETTTSEPLEIEVRFRREAAGYAAEVRASGRTEGVREVTKEGQTCAPLAEAVSVVLAVLLDLRPRDATPAPVAPAPAPPAPTAAAPAVPPQEPEEPGAAFGVGLGVEGGASYRMVGDGVAATIALAVRPRIDRWEGSVGGFWMPHGSATYLERGVDMSLLSARVGGCAWLERSRAHPNLGACAGFSMGSLSAEGSGFATPVPATDAWFAFDAGIAARVPVTRKWAARLTISASVPTREQTYWAQGTTEVIHMSPVGGLVSLGPELDFP